MTQAVMIDISRHVAWKVSRYPIIFFEHIPNRGASFLDRLNPHDRAIGPAYSRREYKLDLPGLNRSRDAHGAKMPQSSLKDKPGQ